MLFPCTVLVTISGDSFSQWCAATGSCKQLRWLHVPKTGSTFGLVVYRYACAIPPTAHIPSVEECNTLPAQHPWKKSNVCHDPEYALEWALQESYPPKLHCTHLVLPFAGHAPVSLADLGKVVTILRHPVARATSLLKMLRYQEQRGFAPWKFVLHAHGVGPMHAMHESCNHLLEQNASSTTLEMMFARGAPCISGVQTKMVIGRPFNHHIQLREDDVKAACALVTTSSLFAFVGLMEKWNESLTLFHATFGGKVVPAEMVNTRPTERATGRAENPDDALSEQLEPFDSVLYECGRRRANADASRLHMPTLFEKD